MKYLVFLISLLLTNVNENYCTCPPLGNTEKETVEEFNNSDLVLIGEVTRVNIKDSKYEFIVCEVFKGELKENLKIEGINPRTCNPVVDENGQWLMFGKLTEKNKFVQNSCGLTNSLIKPWKNIPMLYLQIHKKHIKKKSNYGKRKLRK